MNELEKNWGKELGMDKLRVGMFERTRSTIQLGAANPTSRRSTSRMFN